MPTQSITYEGQTIPLAEYYKRKARKDAPPPEVGTGASAWDPTTATYQPRARTTGIQTSAGPVAVDPTTIFAGGGGQGQNSPSLTSLRAAIDKPAEYATPAAPTGPTFEQTRQARREDQERAARLTREQTGFEAGLQTEAAGQTAKTQAEAARKAAEEARSATELAARLRAQGDEASANRAALHAKDQTELAARLQREGESASLAERTKYGREAEERGFARFKEVSALPLPGEAGGGAAGPAANEEAARAAAFARAKDRAGQVARASLTSLREALGGRGLLGGGAEVRGTADIIGGAAGDLGDFEREQLIQDLDRSADVSDRERAAGLTERGQNLGYRQSLLSLFNAGQRLY